MEFSRLKSLANGTSREVKPCRQAGEKEFDQYARECVRLAEGVEDPELREKLLMYGLMGRPAYRVVPKAQNPTKRHNKSDQG